MNYTEEKAAILANPHTSAWLAQAIVGLDARDATEAVRDCIDLLTLFTNRLNQEARVTSFRGEALSAEEVEKLAPDPVEFVINPPTVTPRFIDYEAQRLQFLRDILCTAIEGGIEYWAECQKVEHGESPEPGGLDYVSFEVRDIEGPLAEWHLIDTNKIAEAIEAIIDPQSTIQIGSGYRIQITGAYTALDAGDIDADLADIIVQVAAYGEVVFS
jgi:hypothetical protein